MSALPFCSHCGAPVSNGAGNYCSSCGKPIVTPPAEAAVGEIPNSVVEQSSRAEQGIESGVAPPSGQLARGLFANGFVFVVAYLVFAVPTYVLPYFGSNSSIVNGLGAASGLGALPQFWYHLIALYLLVAVAWLRGGNIGRQWLIIFPVLAGIFDMVPGFSLIPLLPTGFHVATLIIGITGKTVDSDDSNTHRRRLGASAAGLGLLLALTFINVSTFFNKAERLPATQSQAPERARIAEQKQREQQLAKQRAQEQVGREAKAPRRVVSVQGPSGYDGYYLGRVSVDDMVIVEPLQGRLREVSLVVGDGPLAKQYTLGEKVPNGQLGGTGWRLSEASLNGSAAYRFSVRDARKSLPVDRLGFAQLQFFAHGNEDMKVRVTVICIGRNGIACNEQDQSVPQSSPVAAKGDTALSSGQMTPPVSALDFCDPNSMPSSPTPPRPYLEPRCSGGSCSDYPVGLLAKVDVSIHSQPRDGIPASFVVPRGTRLIAREGVAVTEEPGVIRITAPVKIGGQTASVGEKLFEYTYYGHGTSRTWFRGRFLNCEILDLVDKGKGVREKAIVSRQWEGVTDQMGRGGYVLVGDNLKIVAGGYESGRCGKLPPNFLTASSLRCQ